MSEPTIGLPLQNGAVKTRIKEEDLIGQNPFLLGQYKQEELHDKIVQRLTNGDVSDSEAAALQSRLQRVKRRVDFINGLYCKTLGVDMSKDVVIRDLVIKFMDNNTSDTESIFLRTRILDHLKQAGYIENAVVLSDSVKEQERQLLLSTQKAIADGFVSTDEQKQIATMVKNLQGVKDLVRLTSEAVKK